jgi:cinnamyl-alcohol dehydrogenase
VIGLGGLGFMAARFAKAFNMRITVISTSPSKEQEARHALRADHFVVSTDAKQMKV